MAGRILADANVVMRAFYQPDPRHAECLASIKQLIALGYDLGYTPQAIRETYRFCTAPPDKNGFGLTQAKALNLLASIDVSALVRLDDTPEVYQEWRRILASTHVLGLQAHDAYHAAAVRAHGAAGFLTLDRRDFDRYAGVKVLRPAGVLEAGFALEEAEGG